MRKHAALLALGLMVLLAAAQSVLTNDAVVKMVKAGLGEDIVISTIKSQPGQYTTAADDLIALKKAGVPDKIISAMIDKGSAPSTNPLVAAAAAGAPAPATVAPAAAT